VSGEGLRKKSILGLAGYPLSHSFSPAYFAEKFRRMGLDHWEYRLLELSEPEKLRAIVRPEDGWAGFNVTIPHKQTIIGMLDSCDSLVSRTGAVNVVKIMPDGSWRGYNSDYYGFLHSLLQWLPFHQWKGKTALVFGTGGSSGAVSAALEDFGISYSKVSRTPHDRSSVISYESLNSEIMKSADLLIQTTPVGMYPNETAILPLPETPFFSGQMVIDLIYNPIKTPFLASAESSGALIQNGLTMLHAQAEKAWEIWNYPR
jgi:shikimate dehydrogenase